jgi:hypothetical protein
MNIKQEREMNKSMSQRSPKFTRVAIKDALSSSIFATTGMYMERTQFVGVSMVI